MDKEHDLLRIEGRINGHKAIFLVNSGSTHDFLSEDFVNMHNIQKIQVDDTLHVTLADGSTSGFFFFFFFFSIFHIPSG